MMAKSNLEKLTDAAAEVKAKLDALNVRDGWRQRKLSAKAFVAASLNVSGAEKDQVDTLLTAMDLPENAMLLPSYRRMFNVITEPGTTQPGFKLGGYVDQEGDACLGRLRCTRESLLAAVATVAAKARPDAFGELTRLGELAERAAKLKSELERLYAEIEAGWACSDVTMLPCVQHHRDDSMCRLSVNFTGGAVFIGERLGERLANWRLSQNIAKAA